MKSNGESVIPARSQSRESSRARAAWIRAAKSLQQRNLIALSKIGVDTWKAHRL